MNFINTNSMNFCDTYCCFGDQTCQSPGEFPFNYSKYHRICQSHIYSISNLQSLTCSYCKSSCKIIPEILNLSIPKLPGTGYCFICKTNERYNKSTNLCYDCYANKRCPTCFHITSNTEVRECGHHFCHICETSCFLCFRICNVCFKESENLCKYECGHFRCKDCVEAPCRGCMNMAICETCGKDMEIEANSQDQFICTSCENLKNIIQTAICANCFAHGEIITRDCNHECCLKCQDLTCQLCIKNQEIIKPQETIEKQLKNESLEEFIEIMPKDSLENHIRDKKNCPNCKENCEGQIYKMFCTHEGCSNCYNKRKCSICLNEKCINCEVKPQSFYNFLCNHKSCWDCLKTSCKVCNPNSNRSKCECCQSNSLLFKRTNEVEHICKHPLCLECLKSGINCKSCESLFITKKNNSCDFCGKNGYLSICLNQKIHFLCKNCFGRCPLCSETCPKCNNKLENCPNQLCTGLACKNTSCLHHSCTPCELKNIYIRCCGTCLTLKITSKCKNCSKDFCKDCKSNHICKTKCLNCTEPSINRSICDHPYCETCLIRLESICPICNSIESLCNTCFTIGYKKLSFKCKHLGCKYCEKNKNCITCTFNSKGQVLKDDLTVKDCTNCGKTGNIQGNLLCGHSICGKCSSLNWIDLNFSCSQCASQESFRPVCLKCRSQVKLEFSNKIVFKVCCQYYFCLEHAKQLTGASCEYCLEYQEPSIIRFRGFN